mgnify:CR=1 FL=1
MNKISKHYKPFLEATERAAIAAARLRGCKDGKKADQAATEAMRSVLTKQDILTTVVIGEGERDEAPMLFIGEKLGNEDSDIRIDIAVDPLECTNHCAFDLPDSIATGGHPTNTGHISDMSQHNAYSPNNGPQTSGVGDDSDDDSTDTSSNSHICTMAFNNGLIISLRKMDSYCHI